VWTIGHSLKMFQCNRGEACNFGSHYDLASILVLWLFRLFSIIFWSDNRMSGASSLLKYRYQRKSSVSSSGQSSPSSASSTNHTQGVCYRFRLLLYNVYVYYVMHCMHPLQCLDAVGYATVRACKISCSVIFQKFTFVWLNKSLK